jgi:hypothetical protein
MPDILSEPLTDSEKISRLQQQLKELASENKKLRSDNRTMVAATPSKYPSVNEAELSTLRANKAELESQLTNLKDQFRRSGGKADHILVAQGKIQKQLNEINQKLAARTPVNEYTPEVRSRSRIDQLRVDELSAKVRMAKATLDQNPRSNLALLNYSKANNELKTFVRGLENAHHKSILAAEKQRQAALASEGE